MKPRAGRASVIEAGPSKKDLAKLYTPLSIGGMEVKNRVVMPPMTTNFADEIGAVTQRLVTYYSERAKGTPGLIIVEATCVDSPIGNLDNALQLRVDNDRFIAGLNELSEAIHESDVKASLQLHHAGRQTTFEATRGEQPVSASDVYCSSTKVKPKALTISEIESVTEKFAQAARRARSAGFDAVELHAAHGYLIEQFLSPATNRRADRYGGDLNGRIRFAMEILKRTRETVGRNFPIMVRLSGDEYLEGGLTLNDTRVIAKKLEEAGVDCLDISAGTYDSPPHLTSTQPMAIPRGFMVHLASSIKATVNIPVITVGRINDPVLAESILQEGKADLVAMGRALIADPHLPKKAVEGKLSDVRMCIACMRCSERANRGLRMKCAVNASVGREKELEIHPARTTKRILVVGGGPAGMEAARVASLRGHDVILYEKNRLGGQLNLACVPPHKEEIENLTKYLANQMFELGVDVQLKKELSVEEIEPDCVIVATGSEPLIPQILGIERESVVTAWDVLEGKAKVGNNVIIAGGGMVGCETAEYLAEMGKKVKIVEMLEDIGGDMEISTKCLLKARFANLPIEVLTRRKITEVTGEGVIVSDYRGQTSVLDGDTVVLSLGAIPNRRIVAELRDKINKLYLIGDCAKPSKILEAIHDGFSAAYEL